MGRYQQYTYHTVPDEKKERIGRVIREARIARGLTPQEAAEIAGISRGAWYRWERGDISSATANLFYWLLHDPKDKGSTVYWRKRALDAESSLRVILNQLKLWSNNRKAADAAGVAHQNGNC